MAYVCRCTNGLVNKTLPILFQMNDFRDQLLYKKIDKLTTSNRAKNKTINAFQHRYNHTTLFGTLKTTKTNFETDPLQNFLIILPIMWYFAQNLQTQPQHPACAI